MLKEGESQFLHGGHINSETGENEGYSAGAMLSAGGHGLVLGSVTGTLSPMIGNVADKNGQGNHLHSSQGRRAPR
ncbi:hypothetical protein [Duncaniella muris]|uniref:hypothetical protein n=1 Tax=Duncaniella muris TaxID=2094150 RepID=UPI003F675DFE